MLGAILIYSFLTKDLEASIIIETYIYTNKYNIIYNKKKHSLYRDKFFEKSEENRQCG